MRDVEMDKNITTTTPQGNEPIQNRVIQPVANPAAQPQPQPQVQAQIPAIRMTAAERIGVAHILNEFRRNYENNFAPIIAGFHDQQTLETGIYLICREVDSLSLIGHGFNNILNSDILMRRIAIVACSGSRPPGENQVPFENIPFNHQMFYMNLAVFVVRFLAR